MGFWAAKLLSASAVARKPIRWFLECLLPTRFSASHVLRNSHRRPNAGLCAFRICVPYDAPCDSCVRTLPRSAPIACADVNCLSLVGKPRASGMHELVAVGTGCS